MDYPTAYVADYDPEHPDNHRLRQNLPRWLYYIHHAESQSTVSLIRAAIVAAGMYQRSYTMAELKQRAAEHLEWRDKRPSCFVSTFAKREHALNWGRQRKGPVYIFTIDTRLLSRDPFKQQWVGWVHDQDEEYLLLHRIPRVAIVSCEKIKEAERRLETVTAPAPSPDGEPQQQQQPLSLQVAIMMV